MANILIIDDNPDVLQYLSSLVSRLGHNPTSVENCASAEPYFASPEIQIIISDIYLPDSPPPDQWIAQLKTKAAGRPLFIITGEASDELLDQAQSPEITALLTKPFELAFIKNLLSQASAE